MLGRSPAASLADIAEAAEVGRTTLHRYFPERSDLFDAISADGLERISAAMQRARLPEGPARAALLRACRELFDLGELLMLIFNEPQLTGRPEWQDSGDVDARLLALVERGHADGTIDPDLTAPWVQSLLWCMVYAASSHVRDVGGSRHDALAMALRSLDGAVRPHT